MNSALHQQLLAAHEQDDPVLLAGLYGQAANEAEACGNVDETCFFLTQAYVFALEGGLSDAAQYNGRLAAYGRDVLRNDLAG
ncbi:MAG: hypothetical protein AAF404_00805, partial [Pseudomonadota bacterium]